MTDFSVVTAREKDATHRIVGVGRSCEVVISGTLDCVELTPQCNNVIPGARAAPPRGMIGLNAGGSLSPPVA